MEPGYTNWATGEPNNAVGGEDCAHLKIGLRPDIKGTWVDQQCNISKDGFFRNGQHALHALCEFDFKDPSARHPSWLYSFLASAFFSACSRRSGQRQTHRIVSAPMKTQPTEITTTPTQRQRWRIEILITYQIMKQGNRQQLRL